MQTVSSVSLPQDMLLNLYFSWIPRGVVKGVVSNPLFQIFLDPALRPHQLPALFIKLLQHPTSQLEAEMNSEERT